MRIALQTMDPKQILGIDNLHEYAERRCKSYFIKNNYFHHLNKDYSFKNDNLESIRARERIVDRSISYIFTSLKNAYNELVVESEIIKEENKNLKQENEKKDELIVKLRKELYKEKEQHKIIMQENEKKDKEIKNLREEIWDKIRGVNY